MFLVNLMTLGLLSFTYANNHQYSNAGFSDTTGVVNSDTLIVDSVTEPIDPKESFRALLSKEDSKELFLEGITVDDLHPEALSFLMEYHTKNAGMLSSMKEKNNKQLLLMESVLEKNNLPKELTYLAVIESYLKLNARSRVGALGPWQFMPATARNMGLRITKKVDERRDLYKSTVAASKYLTTLYNMYGDWLLVIAAYNGGPGKVNAAIKKSGSTDFWTLQAYLPKESRNHVKKFIATHYILEGSGGITTLTKEEAEAWANAGDADLVSENEVVKAISGRYVAEVIIRHLIMEAKAFNSFNPNFDKKIAENGIYDMRLPADKMDLFITKKTAILEESFQLILGLEKATVETATPVVANK